MIQGKTKLNRRISSEKLHRTLHQIVFPYTYSPGMMYSSVRLSYGTFGRDLIKKTLSEQSQECEYSFCFLKETPGRFDQVQIQYTAINTQV